MSTSRAPWVGHTGQVHAHFVASVMAVGQDDELEYMYVGVADAPFEPEHEFQLQKSLESDPQDEALGMDTYCIVLEDQATHYGGITSCVLEGRVLTLDWDEEAGLVFGADGLRIELGLDDGQIAAFRRGLERMFENDRCAPPTLRLG